MLTSRIYPGDWSRGLRILNRPDILIPQTLRSLAERPHCPVKAGAPKLLAGGRMSERLFQLKEPHARACHPAQRQLALVLLPLSRCRVANVSPVLRIAADAAEDGPSERLWI